MRLSGAVSYMRGLLVDDPKQFYKIGDAMVAQGHLKASYSPEDVIKVWTAAAQVAADYYQGGAGKKLTVGQVLSLYAPANAGAGLSDLAGTGVGPGRLQQQTFHSTESTANISSASELTEPGRQAAQQEIGRELTPAEFGKLVAAVQGAQHAAPSITTQSGTTTTSADGTDTSSARNTTTTGGVDVNQLIDDQLRANPNYAEHQAAAHFMPLLMSALGATV